MNGRIEIGVEKGKTIVSVFDARFDEDNLMRILAGVIMENLKNNGNSCKVPSLEEYLKN